MSAAGEIDLTRGFGGEKPAVLFVDDEVENLRVFEMAFRRDFKILTARNATEGLEVLSEERAAVVLSDQRMPGMSGVEFLSRVREVDPHAVRMLVTAYGDFETLSTAINQGNISRFIPKPWSPDEMRHTLRQGIESYTRDNERRVLLREFEVLHRAGSRLCAELEIDAVLDQLLGVVVDDLGFDGATVLLREPERNRLRVARTAPRDTGVADAIEGLVFPVRLVDEMRTALREGEIGIVSLTDLYGLGEAMHTFATELSADEILVVPLPGAEEGLGILAIDNRRGSAPLVGANQSLLSGLAATASIAVENARLVRDVRESQELARRADRLGTLGTLAAGLAHEINNPLVAIHTFLSVAPEKRDVDDPDFWEKYHQLATRELERIQSLVRSMSQLGCDHAEQAAVAEPVELPGLIADALTLVEGSVHAGEIELATELPEDLWPVQGVADHLHQVVTNLLLNAIHASPDGGRVELRAENLTGAEPRRVALCVQDWGSGIEPEALERIFDPFFTTKAPDQGAGLGLMIAHRLVTDHGGTIAVESQPGEGATFRVELPAAALSEAKEAGEASEPSETPSDA